MGKLALGTALLLAAAACGGPQEAGGPGATCFRDDECTYGFVCAAVGNGERVCTNDVTDLVSTYAPEMPAAEPPTGGGAAAGGAANGGTTAGGADSGGVVGAGGTEPATGGTDPGTGGTPSGAGAPNNAGAPGTGGSTAEEPAGGAPAEPTAGDSG